VTVIVAVQPFRRTGVIGFDIHSVCSAAAAGHARAAGMATRS
jgi:hypothetical protein